MTMSPKVWGAGLACALGGAVAGNALGSTPVLDRPTIGSFYQSHETSDGDETSREAPPDHYPLVTRNGTVPVGELSMRGLYSQRRYRAYIQYADYVPAEASAEDYRFEDDDRRYASPVDELAAGGPAPEPAAPAPEASEPLRLAGGPATLESQGTGKLIDVKATLAMR